MSDSDQHQSFREAASWAFSSTLSGVAALLGIGAALSMGGAVIALTILVVDWVRDGFLATAGTQQQLPALLLTAASLFILIFSVLVGLAAVFGWRTLKKLTTQEALDRVEEELDTLKAEHRMTVGHLRMKVFNRFAYKKLAPETEREDPIIRKDEDFLDEAIEAVEAVLSNTPDGHEATGIYENNLAFLLSIRKNPKDANRAIELAENLREHFPSWEDPGVLNTYARVAGIYAPTLEDPRPMLSEARNALEWILEDQRERVTGEERKNARRHVRVVRRTLQNLSEDSDSND